VHDESHVWCDILEYRHLAEKKVYKPWLDSYYDDVENREEYCPPIPESFVFPLQALPIGKRTFPAPAAPGSYLRVVYGDFWTMRFVPLLCNMVYHPIDSVRFVVKYFRELRERRKRFGA